MLSSREADVANSHYATDRLVAIAVALGVIADMARAPEMVAFDPSRHFGRLNCCAAKWCLASSSDRIEGNSAHLGKSPQFITLKREGCLCPLVAWQKQLKARTINGQCEIFSSL